MLARGRTCLFAGALAGLAPSVQAAPIDSQVVERVVAVVDGEPIWLSEVRQEARISVSGLADLPRAERAAALARVVDQLVERRLFARAAQAEGIVVTREQIDAALQSVAKQNGLSLEELFAATERRGLSKAAYRTAVAAQLLEMKVLSLRLNPEDIRDEAAIAAARARVVAQLRGQSRVEIRLSP